jgi:hypothetical protein
VLDENGWVKKLEIGCRATKILCGGDEVEYPSGTYVMLFEGEGEIELHADVGVVKKAGKGRLEIDVASFKGMFAIDLIATNPNDYMRNIRVIAPGLEESYQTNPWHPHFLNRWSGVSCIRVMDMMATNHSTQSSWENRPKPNDATFTEKGVPVELLIDLANRLKTDIWFCMPHLATDEYIKQFATIVKNNLNPTLHAWVEYSNEIWNGAFDQYDYAAEQGTKLNFGNNPWEASFHFNAKRSVEIFKIWEAIYGGREHFISVIASQAANEWLADQLLSAPEVTAHVDVLAIAPYVSLNVYADNTDEPHLSAKKVAKWDMDKLFNYINTVALPESRQWIQNNKKVADAYGVKLVAYEAGQHLVGVGEAEKNQQLSRLFIKANQDQRMGDVYAKHLNDWEMLGGDLMCLFSSTEIWSQYGSWGLLQQYNEKASNSPKFKAVMDWAKSRGQKVSY